MRVKNPALDAESKARESLRILAANLRRAAKHPGEPEAIHHLRVSIRRFNQVLRVFDGLFSHSGKMRHSLRGIMELCASARNYDVALEVLQAAGVPADHALEKDLKQCRVRAGRKLARLLEDWHVRSHVRRWQSWLKTQPGDALPAPALPGLSREFFAAGTAAAQAEAGVKQMHKFRLLAKQYRYTLETLGERAPAGIRMAGLRGLQERLGAINDCAATAELIDDLHPSAAEKRKIKTALNRLIALRVADFRTYWRTHFTRRIN